MLTNTDLFHLVNGYTYFGIAFYYIIFDFVSPVSDEMSLITIAYLAKNGIVNIYGGALMSFLALYFRNIILFYLARNRTGIISKLTDRYPDFMENYKNRMSKHLFTTVLIMSFIPKIRILVPLAAGFGRVSQTRFFLFQGIALTLFIILFYPLGIFFYAAFRSIADKIGSFNHYYLLAGLLLFTILISFVGGRYLIRKMKQN
ncbi:MAG: hypothetical protein GXO83_02600 [Chlorobi bacterium]|nr:hypothetical protein [Chlorobiota bacterium]